MTTSLELFETCDKNSLKAQIHMKKDNRDKPDFVRVFDRIFRPSEVATLLGIKASRLNQNKGKEKNNIHFPERVVDKNSGKEVGYDLTGFLQLTQYFGLLPKQQHPQIEEKGAATIAIINQKGGVAKTTTALNTAQSLALKGYKVCLVEIDGQCSLTDQFNIEPIHKDNLDEYGEPYHIHDYLLSVNDLDGNYYNSTRRADCDFSGPTDFKLPHPVNLIHKTHWEGAIDIIPGVDALSRADLEMQAMITHKNKTYPYIFSERLKVVLDDIKKVTDYDIFIIDSPPLISLLTTTITFASDILYVPLQPSRIAVNSTLKFFSGHRETLESLHSAGITSELKDIKILFVQTKSKHLKHFSYYSSLFGLYFKEKVMRLTCPQTKALENADSVDKNLFELNKSTFPGDAKTYLRAVSIYDELAEEILSNLFELYWTENN